MAKQRIVNTRFWSDGFIRTKLNCLDRYLFLYFLTNERTNICGAYELPIQIVASETGIDYEMVVKMIPRFENKIYYIDDWVVMPNFIKHQTLNPSVKQGIIREFEQLPDKVRDRLYTDWGQLGLLNLTKLNLTKPNLTQSVGIVDEVKNPEDQTQIARLIKAMESVDPKNKMNYGRKVQRDACKFLIEQYGFEKVLEVIKAIPETKKTIKFFPSITTPLELQEKWVKAFDAVERHQLQNKPSRAIAI